MKTTIKYVRQKYSDFCLKTYLTSKRNPNLIMFALGALILGAGIGEYSTAQVGTDPGSGVAAGDDRIFEFVNRAFLLIEGNLGALIMISAGLGSIIAAAFGAYRAAVALLVVAVGAFILRSLVTIFFDWK